MRIPHEVNSEKYVAQGHNLGENFWFEWAVEANPAPEIVVYFGECTSFEVRNDGVQCNLTWISNESIYSGTKRMVRSAFEAWSTNCWMADVNSIHSTFAESECQRRIHQRPPETLLVRRRNFRQFDWESQRRRRLSMQSLQRWYRLTPHLQPFSFK